MEKYPVYREIVSQEEPTDRFFATLTTLHKLRDHISSTKPIDSKIALELGFMHASFNLDMDMDLELSAPQESTLSAELDAFEKNVSEQKRIEMGALEGVIIEALGGSYTKLAQYIEGQSTMHENVVAEQTRPGFNTSYDKIWQIEDDLDLNYEERMHPETISWNINMSLQLATIARQIRDIKPDFKWRLIPLPPAYLIREDASISNLHPLVEKAE